MRRIVGISLVCASMLCAENSVDIGSLVVEDVTTQVVEDISSDEIKSADLAETLMKHIPSINIVRRSGIANDIILRGSKKDNINVLIDDSKIYGACPNRMDPPTSHVLSNNVESVEVVEGPYDVENFGTLSGLVKVNTKEISKDLSGEVDLNMGSFGYRKGSFSVSGGNDNVKFLISASREFSNQYEDGDGKDFLEQQIAHSVATANRYSTTGLEAYEKRTLLTKLIFNIDDSSDISLSYNANRSDNVLYPNTPMDADHDNSNIYTLSYSKRDLGEYSKELNINYYYSDVDHPMSTTLRNNAVGSNYMTNNMKSSIWGAKVKNSLDLAGGELEFGADTSTRNWSGHYSNILNPYIRASISSADTQNVALFGKYEKSFGKFDLEIGSRFDDTSIDVTDETKRDRDFDSLNGYVFGTYNFNDTTKVFAGIGKSERVPDARELYFVNSGGAIVGNDDLDSVKNYELDLGFEKVFDSFSVKTKLFYSQLDDYIYNKAGTTFENVDAKIYGVEVSGYYLPFENFIVDYGVSYIRGKKDDALSGQSDTDLGEIPPLKANLSLTYDFGASQLITQVIASDRWDSYDADNGEQELAGYVVVNTKYNQKINKNLDVTIGVDNIFDKTYATTNTYNDITYVATGGTPVLLNDPGRYVYVNFKFSF
ncbi:TonB-dependent receptor [Halarcobacter ebronensis]|uniref:TonB-dependent receptor n=1 Tax=Halarcobacter ebronensis TaxID=1462615 RepID=A0A4Q1AU41_9BACT|nr:TonB-dependent receptor [Halarcobacter ebronensis]QKF81367.1 TonB-dependent receptor [Halarcobacter ebronensis]RXK04928.1 TonB-dependent receptor [Halarcobacter ebronensis]